MLFVSFVDTLLLFGIVCGPAAASQGDDLAERIESLNNESLEIQWDVGRRLATETPPEVLLPALRRALDTARQFTDMPPDTFVPTLIRVKQAEDAYLRRGIVITFGSLALRHKEPYSELIEALLDENHGVRQQARNYLGIFKKFPKDAMPVFLKALQGDDENVRSDAAGFFGLMGPEAKEGVPVLKKAFQDKTPLVRHNAAWAVWKIEGKADEVVPIFATNLSVSDDATTRLVAANMLGKIGPAAVTAVPILIKALQDESPAVRVASAKALASIGSNSPEVQAGLQAAAKDPEADVRKAAEAALNVLEKAPRP